MNKEELYNVLDLLRGKTLNNKLVVFVGAGVSRNVKGIPGWSELVKKMAKEIDFSKCKDCENKSICNKTCPLADSFSADELLKIPQYLYNRNKNKYNEILKENIKHSKVNAPLSDVIFDLNPVHIITTNYDQLLEDSENELRTQYKVIVKDKDLLESNESKYIIKMHGDIDDMDTIVLKEDDYLKYSQNHVLIELFVKSLLADHTVLFLGYSLNDYNIKLIVSWLNNIRLQNIEVLSDTKIGYIVLDEIEIDDDKIKYFGANNIDVVNINGFQSIDDIPSEITDERGRRLYSFVKTISNPSIEENIDFMLKFKYVSCWQLLNLLNIKNTAHIVYDNVLQFLDNNVYNWFSSIIKTDNPYGEKLKILLLNAGIAMLHSLPDKSNGKFASLAIGDLTDIELFNDKLFKLYLHNEYNKLNECLNQDDISPMKKCFYLSIVNGYGEINSLYENIKFSELDFAEKVPYLFNREAVKAISNYTYNPTDIVKYINNLHSPREKEMYSPYHEMFNGWVKDMLSMKNALDKLIKAVNNKRCIIIGGTTISEIYTIRGFVYSQYKFYFYNELFFKNFRNLRNYFHPLIEAILCANSEKAAVPNCFLGETISNDKYKINELDVDIITKFIETKELLKLISSYNIMDLCVDKDVAEFIVECFLNMSSYILANSKTGIQLPIIETIANISILMRFIKIETNDKNAVFSSISEMFKNADFCQAVFEDKFTQLRLFFSAIVNLCSKFKANTNLSVIESMISFDGFFDWFSSNYILAKEFVCCFVNVEDFIKVEPQVICLINNMTNTKNKIQLLYIFYSYILNNDFKVKSSDFLSQNLEELDSTYVIEFVLKDWLILSKDNINQLFDDIINLAEKNINGVELYPDQVQIKLDIIYIFYLEGVINDVSYLKQLSDSYLHLQFLIEPDQFDYTKVDFTNYMWKNFVLYEKTRSHFIAHKDIIVKYLKQRIRDDIATESEKEILYRFFLSNDDNLLN